MRALWLAATASLFAWHAATAQEHGSRPAPDAHMDDNRTYSKLLFDHLETAGEDASARWNGQAWIGTDLNRLWLKTEGEKAGGTTEHAELQALFSRALTPFWDVQAGVRHDFEPAPERNYGVIAVRGLAPYFFDVEASLYVGESGRSALRVETAYELLLTQKLILTPRIELNAYGQDDPLRGIGAGLGDAEIGVRLRYEFRREVAPYIGLVRVGSFGRTRDFARALGKTLDDVQIVAGVRFWF
jgi:copper resistance protein B